MAAAFVASVFVSGLRFERGDRTLSPLVAALAPAWPPPWTRLGIATAAQMATASAMLLPWDGRSGLGRLHLSFWAAMICAGGLVNMMFVWVGANRLPISNDDRVLWEQAAGGESEAARWLANARVALGVAQGAALVGALTGCLRLRVERTRRAAASEVAKRPDQRAPGARRGPWQARPREAPVGGPRSPCPDGSSPLDGVAEASRGSNSARKAQAAELPSANASPPGLVHPSIAALLPALERIARNPPVPAPSSKDPAPIADFARALRELDGHGGPASGTLNDHLPPPSEQARRGWEMVEERAQRKARGVVAAAIRSRSGQALARLMEQKSVARPL